MAVRQDESGRLSGVYYGKTVKGLSHRRRQHLWAASNGVNTHFYNAIRKHGEAAFRWIKLEECETKESLADAERRYIRISTECGHPLYNLTRGGDGGARINQRMPTPSAETRKKISSALKKHYQNMPGTMTGRTLDKAPWYGRKHTEDARKRMSELAKKVDRSYLLGSKNPSARAVYCADTGETFAVASHAAKKYGIDLSSLIKCCRGTVKACKGLRFQYAADIGSAG